MAKGKIIVNKLHENATRQGKRVETTTGSRVYTLYTLYTVYILYTTTNLDLYQGALVQGQLGLLVGKQKKKTIGD
jgi:hypothetical protein